MKFGAALWLLISAFWLLISGAALALSSYATYTFTAYDYLTSSVLPGASVTVYLTGTTTKALLFAYPSGSPIANPMTADSNGLATFEVSPGAYDIVAQSGSYVGPVLADVWISNNAASPATAWYVCSNGGSDSNAGTSQQAPFATLAAAKAAVAASPALNTVSLCDGGSWTESLVGSPGLGVSPWAYIGAYGAGQPPHIDGAVAQSTWTQVGSANAWTASVAHEVDTYSSPPADPMTVFQSGVPMTRTSSLANCEASGTPAFVDIYATSASPITVTVCPGTGDNPNSDGNLYEVTTLYYGAFTSVAGAAIEGVYASRYISVNGPAYSEGNNSYIQQTICSYGLRHNCLIGLGGNTTITDSIAYQSIFEDAFDSADSTEVAVIAFGSTGVGAYFTANRVGTNIAAANFSTPFYDHTGSGTYPNTINLIQNWTLTGSQGVSPIACNINITGLYNNQSEGFSVWGNDTNVSYVQSNVAANYSSFVGADALTPACVSGTTGSSFSFSNSVWYATTGSNPFWNASLGTIGASNVTFSNDIVYEATDSCLPGWTSGTLTINQTIAITGNGQGGIFCVPSGVSYVGNHNIFFSYGGALSLTYHGTVYTSLSAWQTATGQDANSIVCAPTDEASMFVNAAAGNFTIGASPTCSGVAATGAGIAQHWDWNAHQALPGPPTKWPSVPVSLADDLAYVANPPGWVF